MLLNGLVQLRIGRGALGSRFLWSAVELGFSRFFAVGEEVFLPLFFVACFLRGFLWFSLRFSVFFCFLCFDYGGAFFKN